MTKQEKIQELEERFDNLIDEQIEAERKYGKHDVAVWSREFLREIIQAQITALNWTFDDGIEDTLSDFLFHLNKRGLITDYDFDFEKEVKGFINGKK